MVAFTLSVIVTLAGSGAILAYAKRRPVGTPLTWGEAMLASMYVFFLLFMAYGVVPHQWLTWAENELAWRSDKLMIGWGGFLKPQPLGGWNPITINYLHIEHLIAVLIYVVALGANVWFWKIWQNRGKKTAAKTPVRSTFGRPLVKEGSSL